MRSLLAIMLTLGLVTMPSVAQQVSGESAPDSAAPMPPVVRSSIDASLPDARVRLVLETVALETGLPIIFRVEATTSDGAAIDPDRIGLPRPGAILGDFEVVTVPTPTASTESADRVRHWAIRTFGSGPVVLPPISIAFGGDSTDTEAGTIEIASIAGLDTDPAAHRDIAGAVEVGLPGGGLWWWLVPVAVLVAVAVAWWLRRGSTTAVPDEPADTWALARLDELVAEDLASKGRVQPFFFRLTDIARSFIERRFDLAAPDRTTSEFIAEARRHPELGEDVARLLGNLLRSADMVKFAGDRPAASECDRAAETIRRFVIDAGPRPAASSEAVDGGSIDSPNRRVDVARAVGQLERLEQRS